MSITVLIYHCACTIYDLMFTVLTRWLLSVRALLVGVVLAQKRRLFFEKVLHVENSSKGKAKFKVICKYFREELAYRGAMSAMHEHLKRKHPIETEADQPRRRIWTYM